MATPHNAANLGDIAKVALMPGDPLRAQYIAEHWLENPVCFNTVRNMFGYTGTYKGRRLSVMGHGMGVPSAALYSHELYDIYGVETIFRIGSAGAVSENTHLRDVILAMAASTDSNFSEQYHFPGLLAPCASWSLLQKTVQVAESKGVSVQVGQVFTSDQFYDDDKTNSTKQYQKFGILALEMETAGLYWTAQRLHKQALSILTISDHLLTGEALPAEERQNSFSQMMELALEVAWHFS